MNDELKDEIAVQARGSASLMLAYIGVVNGLFDHILKSEPTDPGTLAGTAKLDSGYVLRWCEAAFAFEYLHREMVDGKDAYALSERGRAFLAGSGLPPAFAIQTALSGHMGERIAGLMKSGECPGESILVERPTIAPLFGSMLESMFAGTFENHILSEAPIFDRICGEDSLLCSENCLVADLGCGNGWYLRKLLHRYPRLRALGIDGMAENIEAAKARSVEAGLSERMRFVQANLSDIGPNIFDEKVVLIAMNRALHHVWPGRKEVFALMRDALLPGGAAIIWEPRWPDQISDLAQPSRRPLAFQNLYEHAQGNRLLRPAEIEAEFREVGMETQTYLFMNGNEAVITGIKAES